MPTERYARGVTTRPPDRGEVRRRGPHRLAHGWRSGGAGVGDVDGGRQDAALAGGGARVLVEVRGRRTGTGCGRRRRRACRRSSPRRSGSRRGSRRPRRAARRGCRRASAAQTRALGVEAHAVGREHRAGEHVGDVVAGRRRPERGPVRRGPSEPSAAMSKALRRLPNDSLTTSVEPSAVIAEPFGKYSGSLATRRPCRRGRCVASGAATNGAPPIRSNPKLPA